MIWIIFWNPLALVKPTKKIFVTMNRWKQMTTNRQKYLNLNSIQKFHNIILFLANGRKVERCWVPINTSTWGNERVIYDTKMSCYDI